MRVFSFLILDIFCLFCHSPFCSKNMRILIIASRLNRSTDKLNKKFQLAHRLLFTLGFHPYFSLFLGFFLMFKIYGIKNCNSMKKAFDALQAKGINYEFHDYKKQGIDADTLAIWLKEIGADKVLNKKGTTWRKLTADEQTHATSNEHNLIETLMAQPSLIKRPVLQTPNGFVIGFDETTYQDLSA